MAYIIKNNLPTESTHVPDVYEKAKDAKDSFAQIIKILKKKYRMEIFFRKRPLRGRLQVEIDGFYYYVELFKKKGE